MNQPRVLIDLSNLHSGGGLQVGASFFDEMSSILADRPTEWSWLAQAQIDVSSAVASNSSIDAARHPNVRVVDRRPFSSLVHPVGAPRFHVSFTLFGPEYALRPARRRIVGFADGTSLRPEFVPSSTPAAQLKHQVRRRISHRRYLHADVIPVEAAHVGRDLVTRWGIERSRIKVVPNTVNAALRKATHKDQRLFPDPGVPTFCYPTRAYAHKNINRLGPALEILRERWNTEARVVLTLTDEEWNGLAELTRRYAINVGPLLIAQMADLYTSCDATVFPSLNECFSVTPLEALFTGSPLVAADRPFVREVAADAAYYFDPLDPESIAAALRLMLHNPDGSRAKVRDGQRIANAWPTAHDRAERYLALIEEEL